MAMGVTGTGVGGGVRGGALTCIQGHDAMRGDWHRGGGGVRDGD